MSNEAYVQFLAFISGSEVPGIAPYEVLKPPRLNLMQLLFEPDGVRRMIVNWEQIAKLLLNQVYRVAAWVRDDTIQELIETLLAYPGVPARWREPDLDMPQTLVLPFELNLGGKIARMFSTVTTLSAPQDVTLQELHIEAFYPADPETESIMNWYQHEIANQESQRKQQSRIYKTARPAR
jgi:MmyB-like transcription regulator ligand binding domain